MRFVGRANDWPLVYFTVLTQAAVGACLVRLCFRALAHGQIAAEELDALVDPVLAIALVLLVIGVAVGALHLGHLAPARFALANLRSSRLSRELLFGLLFAVTVAVHFTLLRLDVGSSGTRSALGVAGVLFGLAFVVQIPRVYLLRTVPPWNTWATPAAFVLTALILGPVVVALALCFVVGPTGAAADLVDRSLPWLGLAVLVPLAAQLFVTVVHPRRHVLRYATAGLGVVLLLVFAWWGRGSQHGVAIAAGGALLLVSELFGRFLFYASHQRVGL